MLIVPLHFQLSKQEHRTKDRSDSMSESGFDSDSDPFKFTSSNCSNGHSPTFKHSTSYPPEFDKFAYHSPEHSSFETDTKLSGESKFSLSHDSSSGFSDRSRELGEKSQDSGDKPRDLSDKSRDLSNKSHEQGDKSHEKSRDGGDKSRDLGDKSQGISRDIKLDTRHVKPEHVKVEKSKTKAIGEINDNPKPTIVFSPAIGTVCGPSELLPMQNVHVKSSPVKPAAPKSVSMNIPSSLPSPCPLEPAVTNSPPKPEEQPSSKLYRGKLSFFKQAISQEVSTLQESEKKALAQLTAEAVDKKPTLELTEPVATVLMPHKQVQGEEKKQVLRPDPPLTVPVTNAILRSLVPEPSSSVRSPANVSSSAVRSPVPVNSSAVRSPVPVNSSAVRSPVPVNSSAVRSPVPVNSSAVRSPVHLINSSLVSPKKQEMELDKPDRGPTKDSRKSPVKRVPLSKDLPTNVVRNVVKRPLPVQAPQKSVHPQKTSKPPVSKGSFSPVPVKKPAQKVVHSINSNPIPFVMNGHKVNVVKIEKHHMNPHGHTPISHKDLSVFKFTNDQPAMPQHPGYPIPFSEYIKVQQSRKRKISGDFPKVEGANKTKKVVKGSMLSPPHQITFSPSPLSTPLSTNGLSPTSEIVKVESSVLNKKAPQSPKPSHPVKSRKISGPSTMSTAKKTLQNKLLSQAQTKTKVSRTQSCPTVKEEASLVTTPIKKEKASASLSQAPLTSVKIEPKEEPKDAVFKDPAKVDDKTNTDNPVKTVGTPTPPLPILTDPKSYITVEPCPDGGATVVRLDMNVFDSLNFYQQQLIVDYFFEVTFGETNGVADHVMGIISNGSRGMPNVLKYIVKNEPSLKVKHQVLGKKDVLNCTISEFNEKVQNNHSRCIFHEGGLQHVSLVGTKSEESGALFPDLIQLMELNPFFEVTLPWGSLSKYEGIDPAISNDGPIFWVRPGEQFLQSTSGSRNHRGYRLLKNRETLVQDRTTPHADHSWEDGTTLQTTAAAAFLQSVEFADTPSDGEQTHTLKDVIAFDASNFHQLAEELQLDLYEPPMTQCDIWIEDAKLNQLRESHVKYARLRLKANDMYFIPKNVVHQFKTVAACLSVAWHVRLKRYYDT